jgi:hypothetical protein
MHIQGRQNSWLAVPKGSTFLVCTAARALALRGRAAIWRIRARDNIRDKKSAEKSELKKMRTAEKDIRRDFSSERTDFMVPMFAIANFFSRTLFSRTLFSRTLFSRT